MDSIFHTGQATWNERVNTPPPSWSLHKPIIWEHLQLHVSVAIGLRRHVGNLPIADWTTFSHLKRITSIKPHTVPCLCRISKCAHQHYDRIARFVCKPTSLKHNDYISFYSFNIWLEQDIWIWLNLLQLVIMCICSIRALFYIVIPCK